MNTLRVGLAGCGEMGSNLARKCHSLDDASVVAVYDPVEESAVKLGGELGAKACSSYTDMLGEVDAVIIAAPNDLHAPMTIEAAHSGKHIFCEKPMALSVADCDAMIDSAEKAGVKLMVGQVLRLLPAFWKTAGIISSGELGAPFGISVTRLASVDGIVKGWRKTRKHTGGIIYEVHVHELDFMRHVMGEAKSVYAGIGHFTPSQVEYEDVAFIQIHYANGGIGTLHCGVSSSFARHTMMIQCEKGTLTNGGFSGSICYSHFGEDPTTIQISDIQKEDGYHEEIRSWVESIVKDAPMVFTARDGRAAIELAQAAYISA